MKKYKKISLLMIVFTMLSLMPTAANGAQKITGTSKKVVEKKTPWRIEINIDKNDDKFIEVKWKQDVKADGYIIYRKSNEDGKFRILKSIKDKNVNSFVDEEVEEGKDYYYSLRPYKVVKKVKIYGDYSSRKRATIFNEKIKFKMKPNNKLDKEGKLGIVFESDIYNDNVYIYDRNLHDAVGVVIDNTKLGNEGFQKIQLVSAYDYNEKDNCRWENGRVIIPRGHKVELKYEAVDIAKLLIYNNRSSNVIVFGRYGGRDYSIDWSEKTGAVEERI